MSGQDIDSRRCSWISRKQSDLEYWMRDHSWLVKTMSRLKMISLFVWVRLIISLTNLKKGHMMRAWSESIEMAVSLQKSSRSFFKYLREGHSTWTQHRSLFKRLIVLIRGPLCGPLCGPLWTHCSPRLQLLTIRITRSWSVHLQVPLVRSKTETILAH